MNNLTILHADTREFIYPIDRHKIYIKLQSTVGKACKIDVLYWNRFHENDKKQYTLEWLGNDSQNDFFACELSFLDEVKYLRYYFIVEYDNEHFFYSVDGLSTQTPIKYFEYLCTNENDVFTVPEWSNEIISYQIFVDRYSNGDLTNDHLETVKWNERPSRTNYFGGDLQGIINKFDYMLYLGINMIYLTPIFQSCSNHKYDTIDYFKIDSTFGNNDDLKELVKKCHENNIKIILDGVFNHIGYYSEQFQDVINKGKKSEFWDWFYINGESVDTESINYECVGYYKWMPKLKYSTKSVRKFILKIGEYWINETGIDGWRLDVADEVDFTFWQEFRSKIKYINKNSLILGETWKDGRDLIRGDQMDTIMNYLFRDAVVDFFAKKSISAEIFNQKIQKMLYNYPKIVHNNLYNLLDSHDTPRFITECNENWDRMKLAVVFQMTFPGMPAIYYGDEIGMSGNNDPDCRKPMNWESINNEIFDFYKKLIDLRRNCKALKLGSFRSLISDRDIYGYIRKYKDEIIFVIINNSENDSSISTLLSGIDIQNSTFESIFGDEKSQQKIICEKSTQGIPDIKKVDSFKFEMKVPANHFEILKLKKGVINS